jgi:hypothetical protein
MMRDTADRQALIRLRGEAVGNNTQADSAAQETVPRAAESSLSESSLSESSLSELSPPAGQPMSDFNLPPQEFPPSSEPPAPAAPPAPAEAPTHKEVVSQIDATPLPRGDATVDFESTVVGPGQKDSATLVGAPQKTTGAIPWDASTIDGLTAAGRGNLAARTTAGYQIIATPPLALPPETEPTSTPGPASQPAPTVDGPAMLRALSTTTWANIHAFAGDRAHAAMVHAALTLMLELDQWPQFLPSADRLGREGGDIHLLSGAKATGLVAVRVGRDIDATSLAESRTAAAGADGVLFTLERLNPALIPPGWTSRSIDDLVEWGGHLQDDPVGAAHAHSLSQLVTVRDAFMHDALTDASPWSEALSESSYLSALVQVLHRDVIADVVLGLRQHGWPQLNHEAVSRGLPPTQRVFDSMVRMRLGQVFSEVAIIDPLSPHLYGVRAVAGRVLIFAEGFIRRSSGLDVSLAWGRRNEFLRAVCGLLQIDTKFIEGQATDACRVVEIDSYDLLRADARDALAQTLVETSWVLWERTHEGRFARR